jgi:glycosyltransferase involved in cell wall biosynthesis
VQNLSVPTDVRVWREARALRENGYTVSVICPRGRRYDRELHQELEGVSIYRYPAYEAQGGALGYFLEYGIALAMMTLLTFWVWLRRGFDVIQVCNPPDILFLVALPYKLLGKRLIFDHHDLAPETYLAKFDKDETSGLYRLLRWFERQTFRFADRVMSTNRHYRRIAMDRGGKREQDVIVVRNGPESEQLFTVPPNPDLHHGRRHLLLYVGTIAVQDGVDHLLRAVRRLVRDRGRRDVHTVIMGDGPQLETLQAMARDMDIADYVTFTGRVPYEEVREGISTADVCIGPDPKTPLNDVSTMIKTTEYMALGKPIVAYDLRETRATAAGAALYAPDGDELTFADHIERLLDDEQLRRQMGEIGRRRVERALRWRHSRPNLLQAYDAALAPRYRKRAA